MPRDFDNFLLAEISDAILVKTPEGRVIDRKQGAENIFSYHGGEAAGRFISELIIPADKMEEESGLLFRSTVAAVSGYLCASRHTKHGVGETTPSGK